MLFIPSNLFLRLKKLRNIAEFIFAIGRIGEQIAKICSAKSNAATFYARKKKIRLFQNAQI